MTTQIRRNTGFFIFRKFIMCGDGKFFFGGTVLLNSQCPALEGNEDVSTVSLTAEELAGVSPSLVDSLPRGPAVAGWLVFPYCAGLRQGS